MPGSDAL